MPPDWDCKGFDTSERVVNMPLVANAVTNSDSGSLANPTSDKVRRRLQEMMPGGDYSADQQRTLKAALVDAGIMATASCPRQKKRHLRGWQGRVGQRLLNLGSGAVHSQPQRQRSVQARVATG